MDAYRQATKRMELARRKVHAFADRMSDPKRFQPVMHGEYEIATRAFDRALYDAIWADPERAMRELGPKMHVQAVARKVIEGNANRRDYP